MRRSVVAAPSAQSADAGRAVAESGGSAVDVAIAATLAAMTTELGIVSGGGGAYLTIVAPGHDAVVIDGYVEMPGRGRASDRPVSVDLASMEYGGGVDTYVGWGSVATPGALAAFEHAWRRFGTSTWPELLEPSIALAEDGFSVSSASAYYLGFSHDVVYGWDPETVPVYHRSDGSAVSEGDIVTNPPLADTWRTVARNGASVLMTGELGDALALASHDRGGLITRRDLSEYRVVERPPLVSTVGDWRVATNAPPAVGGITMTALLRLTRESEHTSRHPRAVADHAEAQAAVFGHRRTALDGDRDRLAASSDLLASIADGGFAQASGAPSTVHVSAVDTDGVACAITASAGYGAGVTIPGTGFGLNNCLGEIELTSEGLHALAPGTRLMSNMAPTIATHDDGTVIAIGSPGADRITSALALTLHAHLVDGVPLGEAVAAPRFHVELRDDQPTLAYEPGVDVGLADGFALRPFDDLSMFFGGVQAARRNADGSLDGFADPRRAGDVRIGGTDHVRRGDT
ncbi:MAG: gamma-glutamyltransferase [Acidimicrobiia bacterium]|nr:gamma-glutamyltransferase [Acidimicrobiia bacterium]